MAIRKLRSSYWVDFRWNFRRYRKRSPVNTKAGAQAYEATLRSALARGENVDAVPMGTPTVAESFAEYAERWFRTYVQSNNKPSEQKTKEGVLRIHLLPAFGKLQLSNITQERIEEFKRAQVAKGLHPKTINNQLAVLTRALRCAWESDLVTRIPRVRQLREPPSPFRWLAPAEQRRLLEASFSEPSWRPMVLLALWSGLRLGELLGLDWTDIDWKKQTLTVQRAFVYGILGTPKNGRTRRVPLPRLVLDELALLRHPDGPIFIRPDGRRRGAFTAARALWRIARRAGLGRFGWHTLRHTYATTLVMTGAPIRVVQELLGHSSVTMTERYAHAAPEAMRAAVDTLERSFAAASFGQPVGNTPVHPTSKVDRTEQEIA